MILGKENVTLKVPPESAEIFQFSPKLMGFEGAQHHAGSSPWSHGQPGTSVQHPLTINQEDEHQQTKI